MKYYTRITQLLKTNHLIIQLVEGFVEEYVIRGFVY